LQVIAELRGTSLILGVITLACGVVSAVIGFRAAWSTGNQWMPVATVASVIALASVGLAVILLVLRPGDAFREYGGLYPLDLGLWEVVIGAVMSGAVSLGSSRRVPGAGVSRVTRAHRGLTMAVVATILGAVHALIAVAWAGWDLSVSTASRLSWELVLSLLLLAGVYAVVGIALARRWRIAFVLAIGLHALVLADAVRLVTIESVLPFDGTALLHPVLSLAALVGLAAASTLFWPRPQNP
jgi:hypothetical protein